MSARFGNYTIPAHLTMHPSESRLAIMTQQKAAAITQVAGLLEEICRVYYDDSIGNRSKRAEVMRELAAVALSKLEGK